MGVKVREIAPDFRKAHVQLRMRLLNRNYVGTHSAGPNSSRPMPWT